MIRALMKECMIYKSLYPFQMHRTLVQFHVYIGFTSQKRGGLIYYSISLVVCLPDQADRKKGKKGMGVKNPITSLNELSGQCLG